MITNLNKNEFNHIVIWRYKTNNNTYHKDNFSIYVYIYISLPTAPAKPFLLDVRGKEENIDKTKF